MQQNLIVFHQILNFKVQKALLLITCIGAFQTVNKNTKAPLDHVSWSHMVRIVVLKILFNCTVIRKLITNNTLKVIQSFVLPEDTSEKWIFFKSKIDHF